MIWDLTINTKGGERLVTLYLVAAMASRWTIQRI